MHTKTMLSVSEAQNLILEHTQSYGMEEVPLEDALGRVLAKDVLTDRDYPPFNRSAMDGFALRAEEIKPGAKLKVVGDLLAGEVFDGALLPGQCIMIMTGAPVPPDADAVIKTEEATCESGQVRFSVNHILQGRNIARRGEDIRAGEILFLKGRRITAPGQASLAAVGCGTVQLAKPPGVTVFATGNEVQPAGAGVLSHHIYDSNSYALRGLFQGYAAPFPIHDPLPDEPRILREAFRRGLEEDILVITGGVSTGVADYVPEVLEELGVRPLFHGVKIKPGNPLWVGVSKQNTLVFALPGNPVSVQVAFKVFIEPLLRSCLSMQPLRPVYHPLDNPRISRSSFEEYFPVVLHESFRQMRVRPVTCNGSGDIRATAYSEGIALHPAGVRQLEQDEPVAFFPWDTSMFA